MDPSTASTYLLTLLTPRAANVDHFHEPLPPEIAAQDKGPSIVATVCPLACIMTIFVCARLYTRLRVLSTFLLDDYLILASLVCTWVASGLVVAANYHGAGRHVRALTQDQLTQAIFYTMIGFVPTLMSFGVPKLAVVALFTRIMNPGRIHRWFLWALAGSCFASLCGTLIVEFAQCDPVAALWDKTILPDQKKCWDPRVNVYFAYFSGSYSAFVDFYLAVYPSVVLFKLQMAWRKKLALSSALSLGGVAAFVAIYKCTRLPSLASKDYTYDTADLVIWTSIESNTLIIATCIPILRPLVDRVFGRRLLSSGRTGATYGLASEVVARPSGQSDKAMVMTHFSSSKGSRGSPTTPYFSTATSNGSPRKHRRGDLESSFPDSDVTVTGASSDSLESILGLESAVRSVAMAHSQPPHHHQSTAGQSPHYQRQSSTAGIIPRSVTSQNQRSLTRGVTTASAEATEVVDPETVGLALPSPPAGAIMRTTDVTVSYDARSQKSFEGKGDGGREGAGNVVSNPEMWRPRHF